jgi:hypothetical protein
MGDRVRRAQQEPHGGEDQGEAKGFLRRFFVRPKISESLWQPAVFGLVLIVVPYGLAKWSFTIGVVAAAIAGAMYAIGGFFGFLFGIPRALTAESNPPQIAGTAAGEQVERPAPSIRYSPNTNLEQVSDWLTKLLIGAGLVQLGQLRGSLADLVEFLKPALGNDDTASVFAAASVLYFLIGGFICGWLATRLWLQDELETKEREERKFILEARGITPRSPS